MGVLPQSSLGSTPSGTFPLQVAFGWDANDLNILVITDLKQLIVDATEALPVVRYDVLHQMEHAIGDRSLSAARRYLNPRACAHGVFLSHSSGCSTIILVMSNKSLEPFGLIGI
jgi:hypothetical protein